LAGAILKEVSVVVSTYSKDRLEYVVDCVESLKRQSYKPIEIFLVLDPVPELVEFYRSKVLGDVRIVVSEKFGLSNARNSGVKRVSGEIIAFIDDDAVADVKWLENIVKNYEDPKVVGVGGFIKPSWESGAPAWFPEELNWIVGCSYKGLPESKTCVRNPIGCNMSFRKDVFEKVGYFRSDLGRFGKRLLAGEEPEFSIRILKKNPLSKIMYDPSAVVFHRVNRGRASFRYLFKRSFYEGVSKALITSSSMVSNNSLSTESGYLKYLLRVAVPSRLRRIYLIRNLCQSMVLLFSVFVVFLGFSVVRLGSR